MLVKLGDKRTIKFTQTLSCTPDQIRRVLQSIRAYIGLYGLSNAASHRSHAELHHA